MWKGVSSQTQPVLRAVGLAQPGAEGCDLCPWHFPLKHMFHLRSKLRWELKTSF